MIHLLLLVNARVAEVLLEGVDARIFAIADGKPVGKVRGDGGGEVRTRKFGA